MVNGYSINSINNKSPLWKQLGYSSEAEWRQATGTGSYSYNNEARFLEWYKRNYGVDYDPAVGLQRPEGMDDGVWAAGNTLYSYYLEEQRDEKQREELLGTRNEYYDEQAENLLANYATAQEALDKSKRNSQQTSSITYDKLKKYLPTQIKAQGLGGLGVSETTMLQAQTNYANEMGEIERAYSEDSANLASNKADDMTNLEKYRQDALDNVNDTYDSIARTRESNARLGASADMSAYKTAVETTQKNNYDNALNSIDYSGIYDQAEMNAFVEKFRGTVSDEQFISLVSRGESVVSANSKGRTDAEQEGVYDVVLADIEKLDYTSQSDMDAYIEGFRGKVSESQLNQLFIEGQAKVRSNVKSLNDSNAAGEATNIEVKFETMLGSDGKISQSDYEELVAMADAIGAKYGATYRTSLDSTLEGYKMYIRSASEQESADREDYLNQWKTGVDGTQVTIHSDYGGGFSLSEGMKVKIKDGDTGMSLDTFATKAEKSGGDGLNSGEAGWFGSEKKDSKAIAKLAKEGKLANGTIVDTNAGDGTKYWVYINGYFYRVELTQ